MASRLRATLRGVWWKKQIDALKRCAFCGGKLAKRYVAIEQHRRLVCDKCGQITYTNPKVVAGLIPMMPDGSVVLLRREIEPAKGKWSYPAGYQELGETVEQAAVRETWEEICVRVKVTGLVGIYSYPDAGVVTIVYAGKVLKGEIPAPGIESQDVQLYHPSKIPWNVLAFRSTTEALRDWNKKRQLAK